MTTERQAFLERVRQAVAAGNKAGGTPGLKPRGDTGYQGGGPDPVVRFCCELTAAGGLAHLVPDAAAAAAQVIALVAAASARRVLLGRDVLVDAVDLSERLRSADCEVSLVDQVPRTGAKDDCFVADIGISGVRALVAETGTVVMASGPAEPRSLSLLPPLHIAIATRAQLLPDLFDLFAALGTGAAQALPSCLTLITGPSKTGDIELRLVTGVHGPGAIHVVLVTG
jgi:L-lactate dehydrogenase complex protein LldG